MTKYAACVVVGLFLSVGLWAVRPAEAGGSARIAGEKAGTPTSLVGGPTTHFAQARHALKCIQDPELRDRLQIDEIVGWDDRGYYSTIQTATVQGELYLLARSSTGMVTYRFDAAKKSWKLVSRSAPAWSDANGWDRPERYSTIRTAVVGGELYLLGRDSGGLTTFKLDASANRWKRVARGTPAWSDEQGWNQPQYYSTIRAAVVQDQLYVMARGVHGMGVVRLNAEEGTWETISGAPAWSNANGWNKPENYQTIRTAVVRDQLYLMARGGNGMGMVRLDTKDDTWETIPGAPAWSNANGWNKPENYQTIRTAVVRDQLYLMARGGNGMGMVRLDTKDDTWETIPGAPAWSNASGWNKPEYYRTIRTAVARGQLYLMARGVQGMGVVRLNVQDKTWETLPGAPAWTDADGWNNPQYYSTIQTAVVRGQLHLMARGVGGMYTYKLNEGEEEWTHAGDAYSPALSDSSLEGGSLHYPPSSPAAKIYRAFQSGCVFPDIPNPQHTHDVEVFHAGFGNNEYQKSNEHKYKNEHETCWFLNAYARKVKENPDDTELLAHFFGVLTHTVGDIRFDGFFFPHLDQQCSKGDFFADVKLDKAMSKPLLEILRLPDDGYVPDAMEGIINSVKGPPLKSFWPQGELEERTDRNLGWAVKNYDASEFAYEQVKDSCPWAIENYWTDENGGVEDVGRFIAEKIDATWQILLQPGQVPSFKYNRYNQYFVLSSAPY